MPRATLVTAVLRNDDIRCPANSQRAVKRDNTTDELTTGARGRSAASVRDDERTRVE